ADARLRREHADLDVVHDADADRAHRGASASSHLRLALRPASTADHFGWNMSKLTSHALPDPSSATRWAVARPSLYSVAPVFAKKKCGPSGMRCVGDIVFVYSSTASDAEVGRP